MPDIPVLNPFVTDALVTKIHLANEAAGQKERAFNTSFRHSDAGKCARAMAYSMLGYEQTEPPDLAGEWVMYLGTLIHEKLQEALQERFGSSCEVEVKVRHSNLSSGHIDAVISNVGDIGTVAYELKTKGGYGFDKAIGINRKGYRMEIPEGPGAGAKIQGALNASAVNADLLVIGVIGLESISRQLASRVGFGDLARFLAEWHYSRAEYMPWATAELDRMDAIQSGVEMGMLGPRSAIGDEHQEISLNPDLDRADYRCVYCQYRTRCCGDGAGVVAIRETSCLS